MRTKWDRPPLGGIPVGLKWESIYPLMDRLGLSPDDWNQLHDDLTVMEIAAISTIREFAPKTEDKK